MQEKSKENSTRAPAGHSTNSAAVTEEALSLSELTLGTHTRTDSHQTVNGISSSPSLMLIGPPKLGINSLGPLIDRHQFTP